MNELERFLSDWAQVYVLVSRLWRSRRAAGAPGQPGRFRIVACYTCTAASTTQR